MCEDMAVNIGQLEWLLEYGIWMMLWQPEFTYDHGDPHVAGHSRGLCGAQSSGIATLAKQLMGLGCHCVTRMQGTFFARETQRWSAVKLV